jgi:hypothetical protein
MSDRIRTTWDAYRAFHDAPENQGRMLSVYAGLQPWENSPELIPKNPNTLDGQRQINPALVALVERELEWKYAAKTREKARQKSPVPPLKPHRIPQYIAAVARAVASGSLTAAQGNGLLYAAQVVISLMRVQQPPPPPPNALGFKAPKKESQK